MVNAKQIKGFTLLELLIVIAILSVLAMALILVLNPGETLKKSRDSQRITDLSTLKTALGLYSANVGTVNLDGTLTACLDDNGGVPLTTAKIFYSAQEAEALCPKVGVNYEGGDVTAGSTFAAADFCTYNGGATGTANVNGSGWIPVNFTELSQGSPITNLPLDPINSVATTTAPVSTDLVYRYACQHTTVDGKAQYSYEIDAQLESGDMLGKKNQDGGDNDSFYEIGTNLNLIGSSTNL